MAEWGIRLLLLLAEQSLRGDFFFHLLTIVDSIDPISILTDNDNDDDDLTLSDIASWTSFHWKSVSVPQSMFGIAAAMATVAAAASSSNDKWWQYKMFYTV